MYWLVTPELGAPQQFFCDQSTDGGGWVMIGRGRENWTQSNEGRLTPVDVAQTPTGPAAFSPAQLPASTVDGLLNDGSVDELAEGVRLRRARTVDGSSWQEVRFRYSTQREDWSWQFAGLQGIASWQMDTSSGGGGNTGSFGADNSYRRVDTNVDRLARLRPAASATARAPAAAPPRARTCGPPPPRPAIRGPSPRCSCALA